MNKDADSLKQKLRDLELQKKQLAKNVHRPLFANPLTEKQFLPKNKQFDQVSSQISHDVIMQKLKEKVELIEHTKKLEETKDCTFQPEINSTSKSLLKNGYVPLHEREMPGKKESPPPRPEEGLEEMRNPHPKRKHNPKFYDEQVKWQLENKEKMNKRRMNNALDELNVSQGIPKTNKEANEKLFKKEEDFLERQKNDEIRKNQKIEKIGKQIYDNLFNPAIHRNKKVGPQVFNKLSLYKDL